MKNINVAKRYAEALYSVATEKGQADAVEQELKGVSEVLASHPELQNILLHPSISVEVKKKQISELFKGRVSDTVLNFLQLLFDRRRQDVIEVIYSEYVRLADATRGRVKAEVESAAPLSDEEMEALKQKVGANGKEVEFSAKVNPALIGGLKVRVGDRVFDYTVASQLERFKQTLKY